MAKKTTVDLTERARMIKDRLMEYTGLRNILSAGLVALNGMGNDDIARLIAAAQGLSSQIDIYEDRKKLIKIRSILEKCYTQTFGLDVGEEETRAIFDILSTVQNPTRSSWYVDITSAALRPKVEVIVSPSKLDDFKKVAGPDDADGDMKTVAENAAAQSVEPDNKKPAGKAKPA